MNKLKVFFGSFWQWLRVEQGLAQIPIILGLAILVAGLAAAGRLTQQEQDTREYAAVDVPCNICSAGKCLVNKRVPPSCSRSLDECLKDIDCSGSQPKPTVKPTVKPTSKPVATSKPEPTDAGGAGLRRCEWTVCTQGGDCVQKKGERTVCPTDECTLGKKCKPDATATPKQDLSGGCKTGTCVDEPCFKNGLSIGEGSCDGYCCLVAKSTIKPTAKPTAGSNTPTNAPGSSWLPAHSTPTTFFSRERCEQGDKPICEGTYYRSYCFNDSWATEYCSGGCSNGSCKGVVPTKVPTVSPKCGDLGQSCCNYSGGCYCISGKGLKVQDGYCVSDRVCPRPDYCVGDKVYGCNLHPIGTSATLYNDCSPGICEDGVCVKKPGANQCEQAGKYYSSCSEYKGAGFLQKNMICCNGSWKYSSDGCSSCGVAVKCYSSESGLWREQCDTNWGRPGNAPVDVVCCDGSWKALKDCSSCETEAGGKCYSSESGLWREQCDTDWGRPGNAPVDVVCCDGSWKALKDCSSCGTGAPPKLEGYGCETAEVGGKCKFSCLVSEINIVGADCSGQGLLGVCCKPRPTEGWPVCKAYVPGAHCVSGSSCPSGEKRVSDVFQKFSDCGAGSSCCWKTEKPLASMTATVAPMTSVTPKLTLTQAIPTALPKGSCSDTLACGSWQLCEMVCCDAAFWNDRGILKCGKMPTVSPTPTVLGSNACYCTSCIDQIIYPGSQCVWATGPTGAMKQKCPIYGSASACRAGTIVVPTKAPSPSCYCQYDCAEGSGCNWSASHPGSGWKSCEANLCRSVSAPTPKPEEPLCHLEKSLSCVKSSLCEVSLGGPALCQGMPGTVCCSKTKSGIPSLTPRPIKVPEVTPGLGGGVCTTKDVTGANNPACCCGKSDCPESQECNIPNGYCQSGSSCNPNPDGKIKQKCAYDASQGKNICAWQPVKVGESDKSECTTNAQCAAIKDPIPTLPGGWEEPSDDGGTDGGGGGDTGGGGGGSSEPEPTVPPGIKCLECPLVFACYVPGEGAGVAGRWFAPGYQWAGWVKVEAESCSGMTKPVFKGKGKGDANCSGSINMADFSIWRSEFVDLQGNTLNGFWEANFNCPTDWRVNLIDFSIWRSNFEN